MQEYGPELYYTKEILDFTEKEKQEYYKTFMDQGSNDLNRLAAFRVNYEYSKYFDTSMIEYINEVGLNRVTNEYVTKNGGWGFVGEELTEEQKEILNKINRSMAIHSKIIYIAIKRSIDFIDRTSEITFRLLDLMRPTVLMHLQRSISERYEKEETIKKRIEIEKDKVESQTKILKELGKKYQYTQLDLIILKALAHYLPLPELYFVLEKYEKRLNETIKEWNDIQDNASNFVGRFKEEYLNSSEKLFKERHDLLETRELLLKNIDEYAALNFYDCEEIQGEIIEVSDSL